MGGGGLKEGRRATSRKRQLVNCLCDVQTSQHSSHVTRRYVSLLERGFLFFFFLLLMFFINSSFHFLKTTFFLCDVSKGIIIIRIHSDVGVTSLPFMWALFVLVQL